VQPTPTRGPLQAAVPAEPDSAASQPPRVPAEPPISSGSPLSRFRRNHTWFPRSLSRFRVAALMVTSQPLSFRTASPMVAAQPLSVPRGCADGHRTASFGSVRLRRWSPDSLFRFHAASLMVTSQPPSVPYGFSDGHLTASFGSVRLRGAGVVFNSSLRRNRRSLLTSLSATRADPLIPSDHPFGNTRGTVDRC
jgi:hypothetical protein